MLSALPEIFSDFIKWDWSQIEPYYKALTSAKLTGGMVEAWLDDWSRLKNMLDETYWRLMVATSANTANQEAEESYNAFLDNIYPRSLAAEQKLKLKLLECGISPSGLEVPLRNIRCETELFRETNIPLINKLLKLANQYDKIIGAQTVMWKGQEITPLQLQSVYQGADRQEREHAWRLVASRQLDDREAINNLWGRYMKARRQMAINADLPDYRAYRWQRLLRFDYTPEDCYQFHDAIEQVAVPAAGRLYEKRKKRLGISSVRPWDLDVDTFGQPPLNPYKTIQELESKTAIIFSRIDPQLGEYFKIMRHEGLLDLDNRKGKAPGGFCTEFRMAKRPYIFMNATGTHEDVQTLLHEGGHAFHVFETNHLRWHLQLFIPNEFSEVASTVMEFLSAPYMREDQGGFYTAEDAARAQGRYLEQTILLWPYVAVVDAFQHWVYENHEEASNPPNCDTAWAGLWRRYMTGQDWSDLEDVMATGWQRLLHIHRDPFYYVEYGLAQLGAVQVWRNALHDKPQALRAYRKALSLGGTVPLPELYATADARLAFEAETLHEAVDFIERHIDYLENQETRPVKPLTITHA